MVSITISNSACLPPGRTLSRRTANTEPIAIAAIIPQVTTTGSVIGTGPSENRIGVCSGDRIHASASTILTAAKRARTNPPSTHNTTNP